MYGADDWELLIGQEPECCICLGRWMISKTDLRRLSWFPSCRYSHLTEDVKEALNLLATQKSLHHTKIYLFFAAPILTFNYLGSIKEVSGFGPFLQVFMWILAHLYWGCFFLTVGHAKSQYQRLPSTNSFNRSFNNLIIHSTIQSINNIIIQSFIQSFKHSFNHSNIHYIHW